MASTHVYVPIKGDKQWKQAVDDDAYVVSFTSTADEELYIGKDERLNRGIINVVERLFGIGKRDKVFIDDAWWPNQSRYLYVATPVLSHELVELLRRLLRGEHERWRIQLLVYGDILDGKTEVGGIMIHADKVLVERAILKVVDLIPQAAK